MSKQSHETDIVVIGAGPVGLFAIFEAGMLKMRCHAVDALPMTGGQCAALYPEKPIYDIPGYPAIGALQLVEKLQEQAAPFNPVYHLGQQVTAIGRHPEGGRSPTEGSRAAAQDPSSPAAPQDDGGFTVTTSAGTSIACKAIVIAAGCGAFGPHRPPLAGLERYEASGAVQYLVKRREDFRGKRVVIAGGGDSAVDWALSLSELTEKLYVVHRRPKFRAAPESAAKLQALHEAGRLELVIPYQLSGLEGENGQLTAVVVETLDGEKRKLEADALLPFFGLAMELGPIAGWGLNLHMNHIAVDPATCATSAPGIFAAGDIASYKGKLKLILSGFSEAAMAIHAAWPLVHPGEALHFEYSTTRGVPV